MLVVCAGKNLGGKKIGGRLLFDSRNIFTRQIKSVQKLFTITNTVLSYLYQDVMGLPLFVVVCCLVFLWVMQMVNSHSYVPKYKTVISKTVLFKSSSPNSFRFHRQISFPGKLKELTIQSVELISQKLDLTKVCLAKHCTKVDQTFNLRT